MLELRSHLHVDNEVGFDLCLWLPQVMKLAVRYKRKALTFISSVGVAGPLGITENVKETTLGTNIATEFPGSGGYAFG